MQSSENTTEVLVLAAQPLSKRALQEIRASHVDANVVVVEFGRGANPKKAYPADWKVLAADDLIDWDELRRQFLAMLDSWPRRPLVETRSARAEAGRNTRPAAGSNTPP